MTRLFGCICNQPERLSHALQPVSDVLRAEPPLTRWGLGYIQSGEVLLTRTPHHTSDPVDFTVPLQRIRSDYVIAHASVDDGLSGNDNTQPFRYRRWLYAQQTRIEDLGSVQPALLDHVPGFLRHNLKGKTLSEYAFHIFLAKLHDAKGIDDLNLPPDDMRRAANAALTVLAETLTDAGASFTLGNLIATNGRSLLTVCQQESLFMRNLTLSEQDDERPLNRKNTFRGVLVVSAEQNPGEGFEKIHHGSAVMVSRDIRIEVASLTAE